MKVSLTIVCLWIGVLNLWSQTPEIDSLLNNLNNYTKTDSTKAQLLLDVALKLRRVNPSEAMLYYQKSFEVAKEVNQGVIQIKANNGIAICNGIMGNYPEAIQAFQNTIELSGKFNQLGRMADGFNGIGIVYKRLGNYPQSLENYVEAMTLYDSVKDTRGLAAAHENVGILFDLMKQPDQAMDHYLKAKSIYITENDNLSATLVDQNIAILLMDAEKYDEALAIFNRNLKIYDSLNRIPSMVGTSTNIGYALMKQGRREEAEWILLNNLPLAKEFKLKQEEANITNNLFEINFHRKQNDKALSYVDQYLALAKELNSKDYMKSAYAMYSKLYEQSGDYKKSLSAYKQHKAWSDSLFNEENSRAFKAQEVKVEVLEKNKQLAEQNIRLEFLQDQVQQEARIKWLLIVAAVLLLATVILFYQKFTERKRVGELLEIKNNEISRQKQQIEEFNYQLENRMLRAQINPHFIFNSLSSIQHFITSDDKQSALKYLTKFSNLLRHVLESSITGNVLISEEIKLLSMYLELEALRFNNDFKFNISVDDNLDVESLEMPTMILQPLIENALLHGLLPKSNDRKLDISFELVNDVAEVKVRDNGIGREASMALQKVKRKVNPSRGIGVTQQRLATLREKYGWDVELVYEDLTDTNGNVAGTQAILRIPVLENQLG